MRFPKFLIVPFVLVTLLSLAGLVSTTFGQVDIPLEDVGNDSLNETASGTSTSDGLELMTLKAQLKPHENEFFAKEGYYQIKKFGFVASNSSEICPMNNCKYGVENGEFSPLTNMSGRYDFEGRLKVTTVAEDVKKSKFYNFGVYLDKTGEEERNGETVEVLEGTFGLGKNTFNPDISYDITNATLLLNEKNPVLTIQG